ncbi:MAG: hypothetical protein GF309_12480 [Candidatus Lokiarchaeota archaeon]|nr:hypothetical protein [Candidatus Lokiarchaeota archaeon]
MSQDFLINRTISGSEDTLVVDSARLANEETGLRLWVSHGFEYVSPVILVRLYQKNLLGTDFRQYPIRHAEDEDLWRTE